MLAAGLEGEVSMMVVMPAQGSDDPSTEYTEKGNACVCFREV